MVVCRGGHELIMPRLAIHFKRMAWGTSVWSARNHKEKSQRQCARWVGVGSSDLQQSVLDLPRISDADGQIVAPGAPLPGTLVEAAGSDLVGDEDSLVEILGHLLGCPLGWEPLDLRLLRLHEDAERGL